MKNAGKNCALGERQGEFILFFLLFLPSFHFSLIKLLKLLLFSGKKTTCLISSLIENLSSYSRVKRKRIKKEIPTKLLLSNFSLENSFNFPQENVHDKK